jgi:hypothetical protein
MTHHVTKTRFPNSRWALVMQDLRIISAFAVWITTIGALPILIFRAVTTI